jgi:SNF family Na+-dependent transporter
MWNPNLSKLGDFKTWLAAAGQIFFTLTVGFGVILNYASYLRRKSDVVLSGLTASATNELFEVGFGGLITIPAAFVFLGASGAIGTTFGTGFNTLPVVFEHMGGFGRMIGGIWFFMLFLAAITSSLSLLQPVKAFFQEALGVSRRGATLLLLVISTAGSLWVIYFSKDLIALDTIDFWVGTTLVFVMAMIQIICFSWIFGVDRGLGKPRRAPVSAFPDLPIHPQVRLTQLSLGGLHRVLRPTAPGLHPERGGGAGGHRHHGPPPGHPPGPPRDHSPRGENLAVLGARCGRPAAPRG